MRNEYLDPDYAKTIADMKVRSRKTREELGETDRDYPKIQAIIDRHWDR